MKILIADDARDSRMLLSKLLSKWGHAVITAEDGEQAWSLLQDPSISFVITDWIMPRMTGLELCRKIRSTEMGRYVYIIVLTVKEEKAELVEGMDSGADDFISKPVHQDELRACIRAGERILELQHKLQERNERLEEAYSRIRADVQAAANLQRSLLPPANARLPGIQIEWLFLPCDTLGGDIFNFFRLSENCLGFYSMDAAGHGIPSAMLSVSLSRLLTPEARHGSPLHRSSGSAAAEQIVPPAEVLAELNQRFACGEDMLYFTMAYGTLDLSSRCLTIARAGHPRPLVIGANGAAHTIEEGGLPVGMFPDTRYDQRTLQLRPGDRIFLYSDGTIECANPAGHLLSEPMLLEFLREHRRLPLAQQLEQLRQHLQAWHGSEHFEDDISILALELAPTARQAWRISSDLQEATKTGQSVYEFCVAAGVPEERAALIRLCAAEALNNAVLHAYQGRSGQPISLELSLEPGQLRLEISDEGKSIPARILESAQPTVFDFDPDELEQVPERGMGLAILKTIMDQVEYHSKDGVNTLYLLQRTPEP